MYALTTGTGVTSAATSSEVLLPTSSALPSPAVRAPGLAPTNTTGLWVGTVVVVLLLIGGSVLLVVIMASRRWRSGKLATCN